MTGAFAEKTSFSAMVGVVDQVYSRATSDRCLKSIGLNRDVLSGHPGFLPVSLQAVFFETAARLTGDELAGQRLGSQYDYSDLGWYARHVLSAPVLLDAFLRGTRALEYINPGCTVGFRIEADHIVLTYDFNIPTVNGIRRMEEGMPGLLTSLIRHFAGEDWRPEWVELPGPARRTADDLEEGFGAPVIHGAETLGIGIKKSDLLLPNLQPAGPGSDILVTELPRLIGVRAPQNTCDRVLTLLQTQIQLGDMSIETIAERLSIGPRTLERQLQLEGETFRSLKQRFLKERSLALLNTGIYRIDDIAIALGYSEPNSFRRAFKKWTGFSPTEFMRMAGE